MIILNEVVEIGTVQEPDKVNNDFVVNVARSVIQINLNLILIVFRIQSSAAVYILTICDPSKQNLRISALTLL